MLTRRQQEVLEVVRRYVDEHGCAPTLEEIGKTLGLASLATVHKHLRSLESRGAIRRLAHQSRALEIVPPPRTTTAEIPLLGIVAAGAPIEPVEGTETIDLPEAMLGHGETFALRVRGESMVDEGIRDGDVIVVEARRDAPNGATVVALVQGDATVKKLDRNGGPEIRLLPANAHMAPIVAAADEVEIRGVVVGLFRRYR